MIEVPEEFLGSVAEVLDAVLAMIAAEELVNKYKNLGKSGPRSKLGIAVRNNLIATLEFLGEDIENEPEQED